MEYDVVFWLPPCLPPCPLYHLVAATRVTAGRVTAAGAESLLGDRPTSLSGIVDMERAVSLNLANSGNAERLDNDMLGNHDQIKLI